MRLPDRHRSASRTTRGLAHLGLGNLAVLGLEGSDELLVVEAAGVAARQDFWTRDSISSTPPTPAGSQKR